MNVRELREAIASTPDHLDVWISFDGELYRLSEVDGLTLGTGRIVVLEAP